jgi:hypothetical protein
MRTETISPVIFAGLLFFHLPLYFFPIIVHNSIHAHHR